jgi:Protein of unknown function (DUF3047)
VRLSGRWVGAWALLLALALLIGAIVVWSSPRHRASHFGGTSGGRPGATPSRGSLGPAPAPVAVAPPGSPGARSMVLDADGRIRLRVADRVPARLPADGVPPGWATKEFVGRASIELVRDGTLLALRLRSEQTSFALYRDVVVDPNEFRFLAWSWKVVILPDAGDVRERARDDQAAQLYVIFPRWPSPLTKSDVIGYVWDSRAPVGTRVTSSQAGNVKIIVVASGDAERGTWRLEQRDVIQDYVALFGRRAPRIGRVAVMIDTNDTRGTAEAFVGDIVFARTRVENMEMPTSMLR